MAASALVHFDCPLCDPLHRFPKRAKGRWFRSKPLRLKTSVARCYGDRGRVQVQRLWRYCETRPLHPPKIKYLGTDYDLGHLVKPRAPKVFPGLDLYDQSIFVLNQTGPLLV